MPSFEFQGKNIDKAVKKACKELNLSPNEIQYEILSRGSSGIFGFTGVKKARIKVTVPDEAPATARDSDDGKPEVSVLQEPAPAEDINSVSADVEGTAEHRSEENPKELAQEVLQHIVDAITSDATISAEESNGRILLNVAGGNAGILIGKKGQTLEAIQSLVDKIVNKNNSYRSKVRIQVDVEGYLATRKLNLERLAVRLADKSKRIRKPISLGQMNGYDRRTVHLALKDDPEVQTKSRGDGYMRKLVIFPKKNSAPRQPSH